MIGRQVHDKPRCSTSGLTREDSVHSRTPVLFGVSGQAAIRHSDRQMEGQRNYGPPLNTSRAPIVSKWLSDTRLTFTFSGGSPLPRAERNGHTSEAAAS